MKDVSRYAERSAVSDVTERRLSDECFRILFLVAALFCAVSLVSFHGGDPSSFSRTAMTVRNACGNLGAWISAWLLQALGLAGFLVPLAFLFVGLEWGSRSTGKARAFVSLAAISASTLSLAVFLSIPWERWTYGETSLLIGGFFGHWLSNEMKFWLNPVGAAIVSMALFLVALSTATPIRVAHLMSRGIKLFGKISLRLSMATLALTGWAFLKTGQSSVIVSRRLAKKIFDRERKETPEAVVQPPPPPPQAQAQEANVSPTDDAIETEFDEIAETSSVDADEKEEFEEESEEDHGASPRIVKPSEKKTNKVSRMPMRRGIWKLPALEFLKKPSREKTNIDESKLHENARLITQKLADFSIEGQVTKVTPGPVITLYEFMPDSRVKLSKIASLADDLAMALSAECIRILAPIPGKNVCGIEVPNELREKVFLREFLEHSDFSSESLEIPIAMGKDFAGRVMFSDLAKMPHLLCAGQTGSGKSVFMNGLICSLLYRFTPEEMRLILVDPKFIEFSAYQGIPHLLLPVVAEGKDASISLKWAVKEMQRRYKILQLMGVRKLADYNQKVEKLGIEATRDLLYASGGDDDHIDETRSSAEWMGCFELDENGEPRVGKLPYIVIVIDELADLMQMAKKDVELAITRIAQKARAAGIHLVVATQRPSTDVITGLIKANLPSRTSFKLSSFIDSKTILDRAGAERLLGQGDMLFLAPGASSSIRLQASYLQDDEIQKVTSFLCEQGEPRYREEILVDEEEEEESIEEMEGEDEFFPKAIDLGKRKGQLSASMIQREFRLGYNRASRIIDRMEEMGYVGPQDGARPRPMLRT